MADVHNHKFTTEEISYLQSQLLSFYDTSKRNLPWRNLANTIADIDERAYAVWVSEIMLQQTQVATVIDYYNRWMKKWPTLEKLAAAELEHVNEMWSGLGYYSRGRRLHEGAKKVFKAKKGMPHSSKELMKELPGVGRYTAGAVASIAYNEVTGVVDGNVVRVLSRLRLIGADSASQIVIELMWELANVIVDKQRPGDFNQAMMELGATVCTPKSPSCLKCPLSKICRANYRSVKSQLKTQATLNTKMEDNNNSDMIELTDIEDVPGCKYCLPSEAKWQQSLGVTNYPNKVKKKPPKKEKYVVVIMEQQKKFLLQQRPDKGLLAGLWEWPSLLIKEEKMSSEDKKRYVDDLLNGFKVDNRTYKYLGEVVHVFSHLHHIYHIYHVILSSKENVCSVKSCATSWLTQEELLKSAISTAVRKIFKLYESNKKTGVKRKRTERSQQTLDTMLKKVSKK